jgi:AmmeMemoRadiSam system protein A
MARLPFMNRLPPHTEIAGTLLPIARASIAVQLGKTHAVDESAAWLREQGASFITLHLEKKLRGCIGSLRAHRALLDDIKANALAAAFRDPRFKPLTLAEYEQIEVEVSLLSALSALQFSDEASALAQLTPHVHGVIFEYGHHRSTYLPQVWDNFADPAMFMATLKQKAGLPPNFWEPGVKLHTYTVAKFSEAAK